MQTDLHRGIGCFCSIAYSLLTLVEIHGLHDVLFASLCQLHILHNYVFVLGLSSCTCIQLSRHLHITTVLSYLGTFYYTLSLDPWQFSELTLYHCRLVPLRHNITPHHLGLLVNRQLSIDLPIQAELLLLQLILDQLNRLRCDLPLRCLLSILGEA